MSIAEDFSSRRFALYILGAGFSRAAGLPIATELWPELRRRAETLTGRAAYFKDDLETYIEYRLICDGIPRTDQVDFEKFVEFLDVEHYLGLRGKDTWSSDGNETQVVIKTLIGEILSERMPTNDNIPDLYLRFARMLKPHDIVLTFNYDVLLERALEIAAVPFRLFPDRLKQLEHSDSFAVDTSKEEVVVLKMHGSIDWFDRAHLNQLEEHAIRHGLSPGRYDMVFSNMEKFGVVPLVEGALYTGDPLRHMYRVRNVEDLYRCDPLFHVTPSLLNPSSAKILYAEMLKDFWHDLGHMGFHNFSMAIIGFSLPPHDEYARQAIYRLVRNYQRTYWREGAFGHKKSPIVIVDFRHSATEEQEFRRRYAFVEWDKAETYFDGFNEKALDMLERN